MKSNFLEEMNKRKKEVERLDRMKGTKRVYLKALRDMGNAIDVMFKLDESKLSVETTFHGFSIGNKQMFSEHIFDKDIWNRWSIPEFKNDNKIEVKFKGLKEISIESKMDLSDRVIELLKEYTCIKYTVPVPVEKFTGVYISRYETDLVVATYKVVDENEAISSNAIMKLLSLLIDELEESIKLEEEKKEETYATITSKYRNIGSAFAGYASKSYCPLGSFGSLSKMPLSAFGKINTISAGASTAIKETSDLTISLRPYRELILLEGPTQLKFLKTKPVIKINE